jgi:hypothetical protein
MKMSNETAGLTRVQESFLNRLWYSMTTEKYRYDPGHLYKPTESGDAYIHCFKCPSHWSKSQAIKAYERKKDAEIFSERD